MEQAALAISLLSLLVALGVGIWANQIQSKLARLEQERHMHETQPNLVGEYVHQSGELRLTNRGPRDLDDIEWTFDVDYSAHALFALDGVCSGTFAPLPIGESRVFRAEINADEGPLVGSMMLVCVCKAGDRRWKVAVPVEISRPPRPLVW